MLKRIEVARTYGEFAILPVLGFVYRRHTDFKPRLCVLWLCWGISIGLGRR